MFALSQFSGPNYLGAWNRLGLIRQKFSLRSRRLEVVGTITPCVSPSRASVLPFAHYFQAPATQASRNYVIITKLERKQKKIPQMHFEFAYFYFVLIHLELKR